MTGDAGCTAAVLQSLAAAEKLPAVNWGSLCNSFVRSEDAPPCLQEAAVALALRHPEAPSAGIPI